MTFHPELNHSECRRKVALESAVFLVVKENGFKFDAVILEVTPLSEDEWMKKM